MHSCPIAACLPGFPRSLGLSVPFSPAFSLVELLVVVSIIAVLLALLTPALDKAVYQAELTSCAAGLHAGAEGLLSYASSNRRRYPTRAVLGQPPAFYNNSYDTRPALLGYFSVNGVFNDPLCKRVDYEYDYNRGVVAPGTAANGYAARAIWFSWRYEGHRGMFKLGDRFEWADAGQPLRRFNLLVSDLDFVQQTFQAWGSHPDKAALMVPETFENKPVPRLGTTSVVPGTTNYVLTRWERSDDSYRGDIDMNFASDDGAVERWADIAYERQFIGGDDGRVGAVPWNATGQYGDIARCSILKAN